MTRWPKNLPATLLMVGLSLLLLPAGVPAGQERILSFDSRIDIFSDGTVEVAETIRVVAAGDKIRRGIFRDFPTRYPNHRGGSVTVRFQVLEVRRDDRPEAYHTEALANGVRVYIGKKDALLPRAETTYTLVYRTDRQIGFFDDYDEFFWNVTGTGWDFVIEQARVVIQLPPGGKVLHHSAYTGPHGAVGQDYTVDLAIGGIGFAATRPLNPGEGLSVAVAWPKGAVDPPGAGERIGYLIRDNRGLLVAGAGLAGLLLYYLAAWWRVGRDPVKGAIIPRYVPPKGVSPAAMRFIQQMGFDHKALAVALVSMAVKGFLTIKEEAGKTYALEITGSASQALSPGEAAVAEHLFPPGSRSIVLKNSAHRKIKAALKALRTSLSGEFERLYFLRNTAAFIPGLGISLVALAGIIMVDTLAPVAMFMLVWLSGWSVGVYTLGARVVDAWRSRQVVGAAAITLFFLPFLGGAIAGLTLLTTVISPLSLALFLGILAVNALFYHLLKAPTLAGRRLMDEIDGLKLYLGVAEKHRLDLLNPPQQTPEHFEALLPHAMALGVENAWNEQFARVLTQAGLDPGSGRPYAPSWYSGRTPLSGFGAGLGGSFTRAVAASSRAPGSSSGSRGGGGSGRGGGGGGGGGW